MKFAPAKKSTPWRLLGWLRDCVKFALARNELAELARWRLAAQHAREYMADVPAAVHVVDWVDGRARGRGRMPEAADLRAGVMAGGVNGPSVALLPPHLRQMRVTAMAYQVCAVAAEVGLNVTIEREALRPVAMGHMAPVVTVWPGRPLAAAQEDKPVRRTLITFDPATRSVVKPQTPAQWRDANPAAVWVFNPWTGQLRDERDIQSDPWGVLIAAPGEPLEAA